ncbi:IS110 family transposase [Carboxylicivirga mesophila]|uniref:IS110 family transposase n=1 Tax=Carboxylicivirga mesophila TaxID=1166478 RepID=A0ABS5KA29_9BACT|nr:IS110 family transposase [Carboxylicivirga mesophila]MBS2211865.1 IS110 family transposase [Carboxylicivirga mesophila]
MKKSVVIGIDFSKLTLDVTFFKVEQPDAKHYQQFDNTEEGCKQIIKWIKDSFSNCSDWLICGEYTGLYSMTAAMVFNSKRIALWLENPQQIKLSSGIKREKNDKVDSNQIAMYALRFMDRAKLYKPNGDVLLKVRELVRYKDRLTKIRTQIVVPSHELKQVRKEWNETTYIYNQSGEIMNVLEKQIKDIESKMLALLETDPELKRLYKLVNSVVGIGMQTAIYLLIHTWGFTAFNTPRQLACYCGVAPFSKQSGTSVKGKNQVSQIADKKLKSLLHMCALNAVKFDPFMKAYYERKMEEGKHKMNVLNNVKNKLIYRICAVVSSGQEYDKSYSFQHVYTAA